jgi:hypothetical protein
MILSPSAHRNNAQAELLAMDAPLSCRHHAPMKIRGVRNDVGTTFGPGELSRTGTLRTVE